MYGMVERLDEVGRPAWIIAMIAGFVLFAPLGLAILAFMIWSGRMGCGRSGPWGEYRQGGWQQAQGPGQGQSFGQNYGQATGPGDWRRERWQRKMERMQNRMARWQELGNRAFSAASGFRPTGNRAFDDYRHETIRRLEDEANEFRAFLDRLRHARDKAEFDQFMAERRSQPHSSDEPGRPEGGMPDTRPSGT